MELVASAAVGSLLTLAAWAIHATAWRRTHPLPRIDELREFRAWKRVRKQCWGGETLYRDIVHHWNLLERERNAAQSEVTRLTKLVEEIEDRRKTTLMVEAKQVGKRIAELTGRPKTTEFPW